MRTYTSGMLHKIGFLNRHFMNEYVKAVQLCESLSLLLLGQLCLDMGNVNATNTNYLYRITKAEFTV